MNRKARIDLIAVLLILLILVVGYKLSPLLLPQADSVVLPDAGCDLQQGPCAVAFPGGGILTVDVDSRPLPLVTPFRLSVRVQGIETARIEADFSGVDMNMGYNRLSLAQETPGVYAGQVTLPVCVTGRMNWLATILVQQADRQVAVPLRFTTGGAH